MSQRPHNASPPVAEPLPITPTAEAWRAMSAQQREDFLVRANEALSAESLQRAMSEGRPHQRAKDAALDRLGRFLRGAGKKVYLAANMSVAYPGEPVFEPDVLAVLDVEDTGDNDERLSWVVADEGRGLDWVLEVHYLGDRKKDFVRNVERYARLGITEYFIYDRLRQAITAFRLPAAGAPTYQSIRGHFGRFTSQVLGVELAVIGGRLRFFAGEAELPGTADVLDRLGRMTDEMQERIEKAEARVEEERARAERAEMERVRTLESQRRVVLDVLAARNIPASDSLRAALATCEEVDRLARWIVRAATVTSADAVMDD